MSKYRVEEALTAIANGEFVVVMDDKDRENEGDLIMAAERVTPEALAFMVRHTSGIICVGMTEERLNALELPQMVTQNTESQRTAFTVSVDYKYGTTTGISARDRATTIKALVNPNSRPQDFCRPGHVFPLRYTKGGVLKRMGHTEASVDLARMAGLQPAGIMCELAKDDGNMAREGDLLRFAEEHNLVVISIADLIRYRRRSEKLISCISEALIPTPWGEFTARVYESTLDGIHHIALTKGTISNEEPTLVRVHSECLTGDVFGSLRCDCGSHLQLAMHRIGVEGSGIIVYLRGHEGRGVGLAHKIRAYNLQDRGRDTVQANEELGLPIDSREYGIGAQILADMGVNEIRLLTNNPAKYGGLAGYDLQIVERVPLVSEVTPENRHYLETKQKKLGHLLEMFNEEANHA